MTADGPSEPGADVDAVLDPPASEASSPSPGPVEPPAPAPVPSPFAGLSTRASRLVPEAFEVLTRSSRAMRRASFYVGLIVLASLAPGALLVWRILVELPLGVSSVEAFRGLSEAVSLAMVVAFAGLIVASVESRAIAVLMLAATLEGRPLSVREALQRARRAFWRIVFATALVSIPLGIIQAILEDRTAALFRGTSEISVLSASLVVAAIGAPFAYVLTGIVLGDVGPIESARRSIRLFRPRKLSALVVALFALAAEFLTLAALSMGLDVVFRAEGLSDIASSADPLANVLTGAGLAILVFAGGTLLFTVAAISLAPQVVMFLALTHAAPGLDSAREAPEPGARRFRWLTRPFLVVLAVAVVAAIGGLVNIQRSLD